MNLPFRSQPFAKSCIAAAVMAAASLHANAQASSVQIYGLLDAGIDRVSNVRGNSQTLQNAGILAPNLLGFRGKEDLGGGLKANFHLVTQFSMDTGSTVGNFFGRHASVGLEGDFGQVRGGVIESFSATNLGPLRYGRMLPFVSLTFLRTGPFASLTPTGSFDFDGVANARRVQNSVRYDSPKLGDFTFGGMYGFGERAGDSTASNTWSAGATYNAGPLMLGAAVTRVRRDDINNGQDGISTWGLGGRYDFANGSSADLLHTQTENTFTHAKVKVYEAGYMYPTSQSTRLAGQYTYMDGNGVLNDASAHQVNLSFHYLFSKRTNVYTSLAYQNADDATGTARAQLPATGASGSDTQRILRVGLFHAF